jgi:hypothetical protein
VPQRDGLVLFGKGSKRTNSVTLVALDIITKQTNTSLLSVAPVAVSRCSMAILKIDARVI